MVDTTTTWADLLREAKGPLVEALRYKTVLLSELKRDQNPRRWHGKKVTIPVFVAPQQGAGNFTETGAPNTPVDIDTDQVFINSGTVGVAIAFTPQAVAQADGDENSWAQVLPTKMQRAEDALGRVINEEMMGSGNALIAAVTGTNSTSTTVTVGTGANFYQLYPGRVVDLLVRSNGNTVLLATKITGYSESGGTITISTATTTGIADGVYIQGSYNNAIQGIGGAVAVTGTFQGLDKAANDHWQGTDASPASASDPTMSLLDKGERKVQQRSGATPAFFLAEPAVIDKYSQGLSVQARWAGEDGELASGWTGVRYRNKLLVPDWDMPPSTIYGINTEDCAIYTLDDGPDWDDHTGSMFQRFSRAQSLEAWLTWMLQLGFHRCNSYLKIGNVNRAA